MQWKNCGILGVLFFVSQLFCQTYDQINYKKSIERDQFGNPTKMIVDVVATQIPIVDGMKMLHEKREYRKCYEYPINNQVISDQPSSLEFEFQQLAFHQTHVSESSQQSQMNDKQSGLYCNVKVIPYEMSYFESMSNEELVRNLLYNRYCVAVYHMRCSEKITMMSLGYDRFVKKLLQKDLPDSATWELWNEYKNKRVWNLFSKKEENEQKIKQSLKARNVKKQAQVQEKMDLCAAQQKELLQNKLNQELQQYTHFIKQQHEEVRNCPYWNDVSKELYELRERALDQSELEEFKQYEQPYELRADVRGYLHSKNISYQKYEQCLGTHLQQQYHEEILDLFQKLAEQELQLKRKTSFFDHSLNFAEASHEVNQKNFISETGMLSWIAQSLFVAGKDICDRPLEYVMAIAEGVAESTEDFVHMATHPVDTLYGLGHMIYFVLETAALSEAARICPTAQKITAHEKRIREIGTGLSAMKKGFAELDGLGRVKAITKFGADFYIPAKITAAASHIFAGVCSRARGVRTLEGAASIMGDEFGLVEMFSEVEQAELAIERGLNKQLTAEFMEAEKVLGGTKIIPRSLKVIIEEIKRFKNGVIPSHRKDLYNEFKAVLKQLEQQLKSVPVDKLKKMYGSKIINNKCVNARLEHMYNFKFKLQHIRSKGGYVFEMSGGHLPGSCEALEKAGLVKIVDKKVLPGGAIDYTLENCLTGELFANPKTEFPSGWTEEKLAKAVWEVYEKPTIKDTFLDDDIHYKRVGIVDDIEIEIVCRDIAQKNGSKNRDVCNIKTTMPYKDEIKK